MVCIKKSSLLWLSLFTVFCAAPAGALELVVDEPTQNNWVVTRNQIIIKGHSAEADQVLINGVPAALENTQFTHTYTLTGAGKHNVLITALKGAQSYQHSLTVIKLKEYPDVSGHWAEMPIRIIATAANIQGLSGTDYFRPNQPITRAELAFILCKIYKLAPLFPGQRSFVDVSPNHWAYPYIESIYKNNIMSGTAQKEFCPEGEINRLDITVLLLRLIGPVKYNVARPVAPDLPRGFWGNTYIATGYDYVLYPPTWMLRKAFKPYEVVSRAEVMYMLSKIVTIKDKLIVYYRRPDLFPRLRNPGSEIGNESVENDTSTSNCRIEALWASVERLPMTESRTFSIFTKVAGKPPKKVLADLNPINRLSNLEMNDKEQWGDEKASDLTYTATVRTTPGIAPGIKYFPVTIYDTQNHPIYGEIQIEFYDPKARNQDLTQKTKTVLSTKQEEGIHYIVQPGDTISSISYQFTGRSRHWIDIAKINKLSLQTVIEKGKSVPHATVQPGQVILIPRRLVVSDVPTNATKRRPVIAPVPEEPREAPDDRML